MQPRAAGVGVEAEQRLVAGAVGRKAADVTGQGAPGTYLVQPRLVGVIAAGVGEAGGAAEIMLGGIGGGAQRAEQVLAAGGIERHTVEREVDVRVGAGGCLLVHEAVPFP